MGFRNWCLTGLFCLAASACVAEQISPAQQVALELQRGDNKSAIALGKRLLSKTSAADKSALQVQLAIAFARDQELESAFEIFLASLQRAPKLPVLAPSQEEQRLYNDALKIYLAYQGPSAAKAAKEIRRDFAPVLQSNPQDYLLGFLVAASYANLSEFDRFFPLFYESYLRYPDHYLAYKTQALLCLKLWQRGRIPTEREELRQSVKRYTEQAITCNPQDASLYKMVISFSGEAEKGEVVAACLNNIVKGNIIVPREDLLYFVQAALSTGHRNLAQEFVDSARSWYKSSRAVDHAQQLVDSQA